MRLLHHSRSSCKATPMCNSTCGNGSLCCLQGIPAHGGNVECDSFMPYHNLLVPCSWWASTAQTLFCLLAKRWSAMKLWTSFPTSTRYNYCHTVVIPPAMYNTRCFMHIISYHRTDFVAVQIIGCVLANVQFLLLRVGCAYR